MDDDRLGISLNGRPGALSLLINLILPSNNKILKSSSFGVEAFSHIEQVNSFYIYDRWGNQVFSADNFDPALTNQKWDGNYNGRQAMSGVYVYILNYLDNGDQENIISGDVTLIR